MRRNRRKVRSLIKLLLQLGEILIVKLLTRTRVTQALGRSWMQEILLREQRAEGVR